MSFNVASPPFVLTAEAIQDLIGASFTDTATIDFTYNDAGNAITADVIQSGLDHGSISGLSDDDHSQYALLAGRASGQTITGGTAASENLTLVSTSNATKGAVNIAANTSLTFSSATLASSTGLINMGTQTMSGNTNAISGTFVPSTGSSTTSTGMYIIMPNASNSSGRGIYGLRVDVSGNSTDTASGFNAGAFLLSGSARGSNIGNNERNSAVWGEAYGSSTTGYNLGVQSGASGANRNYSLYGSANSAAGSNGFNTGVWAQAGTTGTGAKYAAGFFRIHSSPGSNDIYDTSGALIADNGDTTADSLRVLDNASLVFGIADGGNVKTNQTSAATTLGSVVAKMPIYNASGTLVGYIPVYDNIT